MCNYLDYTASVFPVTFVDKTIDKPAPPHEFRNHEDEAVYKMCECLLPALPVEYILRLHLCFTRAYGTQYNGFQTTQSCSTVSPSGCNSSAGPKRKKA